MAVLINSCQKAAQALKPFSNLASDISPSIAEALPPIFISHSGKDQAMLAGVIEAFDFYNTAAPKRRPYTVMSQDRLKQSIEPYWLQIKKEIERSDAIIFVISEGVTEREYTQNWAACEIGMAAGCNPPKPVIAVQASSIRIPMPYLTHYYSYSNTLPPANVKEKDRWRGQFNVILYGLINNVNFDPEQPMIHCPLCNAEYYYHGPELIVKCPCCPCIIQRKLTADAVQTNV